MARRISNMFRRREHESFGYIVRSAIHRITLALYPYVKVVVPNFRAAHYVYIIFMAFLTSVICYPISSFKYIDILFLLSGACTQAGLNTINLNALRLLQQIIIYIATTMTTPIFIHGSLLFVRLYWFERHFDDIKESSKMNYKMRRNATLAARTTSNDSTRVNTVTNQGLGLSNTNIDPLSHRSENADILVIEAQAGHSPTFLTTDPQLALLEKENGTTLYSEPSDDEKVSIHLQPDQGDNRESHFAIKFGDLPNPSARRKEIEPSDMYKSIAMLQRKRRDSGLDEDVLVIKSPNEIEKDSDLPIYTRKNQQLMSSSSPNKRSKWKKNIRSKKEKWASIKRSLSNTPTPRASKRGSAHILSENESIDSEDDIRAGTDNTTQSGEIIDYDGDEGDNEEDVDVEDDDDDNEMDVANEVEVEDDDEEEEDEDASIRSLFSDDPGDNDSDNSENEALAQAGAESIFLNRKTKFALDPKIKRRNKVKKLKSRSGLRIMRTSNFSRSASRSSDQNAPPNESDDEEHYFSGTEHSLNRVMSTNYLSWVPTIGRNSTFVHLTDEQKEELGGVEYRAVKLLIKIIVLYYVGFHIIAFSLFVGFINVAKGYSVEMRALGFSPTWWGFFTAQSVFNDLGLTLTPDSMMSYSRSTYILIISCFFIVIGNTGFPIFLRFIIWIMFKVAKPLSLFKESLGFLLDHPRRCFTLLFPSIPTWWLFFILIVLNATDLILFIVLDLNNTYLSDIPTGFRVLDGLFQAFSTRTAGFSVIDLSELHPAVQVSYMIMMYISVLPLAISIRRTNVYEEQSLGVYLKSDEVDNGVEDSPKNFVGTHLRNQLSFDLWFIFLGLFIICIAEGSQLDQNNYRFTVFTILFEIISAYGTVGLSLGYPNIDQSFSYKFTTISKLVIIAMMIRGRHRGLPYTLDRAIMLPDDDMQRRDAVQEHHVMQRAQTLDAVPTRSTFNDASSTGITGRLEGLKRTITRRASAYRRNSLFPTPTRLPNEMHELHQYPRNSGDIGQTRSLV